MCVLFGTPASGRLGSWKGALNHPRQREQVDVSYNNNNNNNNNNNHLAMDERLKRLLARVGCPLGSPSLLVIGAMSACHAAWISAAVRAARQWLRLRRQSPLHYCRRRRLLEQPGRRTLRSTLLEPQEQLREARAQKRRNKRQRQRDRARAAAGSAPRVVEGGGASDEAVVDTAENEALNTTGPHPKPATDLLSPVSTAALQAHDAQSSPKALEAEGVHFLPEEFAVPDRPPSLASSAPTACRLLHVQHREVAEQPSTPTRQPTRAEPKPSPTQPRPSSPKRPRTRTAPRPPTTGN